jgi:xanthine dehydrogenase accessory factor
MQASDSILERATALKARGQPFVLATVVRCESPTSAKPGAKAIVDADGEIDGWIGGGCAQPAVIATARQALADGEPRLIRVSPTKGAETEPGIVDFGMTCHSGGTLDIFLEPFAARPSLLIIGTSPAAQALSALAARTGFDVQALFPGATPDLFPDAVRVADGLDPALLGAAAPAYVVVATQGKRDEPGLEAALATGCASIAFIASARKADKLKTYLLERGHDAARVAAIVAPAGIEIGAVTPEEIALSVLGGLVRERRGGAPAVTAEAAADHPQQQAPSGGCCGGSATVAPAAAATAIDPVCGMTVDIATADYRSRYDGRDYYFCCASCQLSFDKAPQQFVSIAETARPAAEVHA